MTSSSTPIKSAIALNQRLAELLAAGDHSSVQALFAESQVQIEALAQANDSLSQVNNNLARTNDDLQDEVRRLDVRVKKLTRILYGRKSEKLTKEELGQLVLALSGDPQSATPTIPLPPATEARQDDAPSGEQDPKQPKKRRPHHHGRTRLSPDLERIIVDVPVAPDERDCIQCGQPMQAFGFVEHETVEFVPAKLVVHVQRREKLACRCKGCQGDAVTAERLEPSSVATRLGASVLAHLIETKCDDGMPLYRIEDQFSRLGFEIPLNTLYSAWSYALDLLEPVAEVVLGEVLASDVVCVDDTSMPVLDTKKGQKKSKGHLWGFWSAEHKCIAYQFTETWSADEIAPVLQSISGFIQVDDYKGYSKVVCSPDGQTSIVVDPERRLGCSMHVRRRFHQASILGDKRAVVALQSFADLYKVEDQAKKDGLDAHARGLLRTEKSVPILRGFYDWVASIEGQLGKTSTLAQAVAYAKHQRPFIERCLSDGRFEIDSGEIERRLREPCIGRKNFLHAGSVAGAQRLATAYTLVQTCRSLGICTRDYLIDVIQKIAGGWPGFCPV